MSATDNYLKFVEEAFNELKSNNLLSAKQIFDKALNLIPDGTLAIYGKALCFYVEKEFMTARKLCEKALKIDENSIPEDFYNDLLSKTDSSLYNDDSSEIKKFLKNGLKLISERKFSQCNYFFDMVLRLYPDNPDAIVGKAYCFYQFGNSQRANALCRTVYEGNLSKEYKALYDEVRRNSISSNSESNNAQSNNTNNIQLLLNDSLDLIDKKLYYKAESMLDKALKIDSENFDAIVGKAYCLYKSNYIQTAKRLCREIKRNNLSPAFFKFYDEIMFKSQQSRNRSSSNSSQVDSLLTSALHLVYLGDFETARGIFKKASRLDSKNPNAIVGQAYCFYNQNRVSYSRTLCKKIDKFTLENDYFSFYEEIMSNKENNTTNNQSRQSTNSNNRNNRSKQSNYSNNSNIDDLCKKGNKYLEEYKIKDAKICFNKALEIDSNNVNALIGNAKCYYHVGYYAMALNECEKALKIDKSLARDSFYLDVKKKVDEF